MQRAIHRAASGIANPVLRAVAKQQLLADRTSASTKVGLQTLLLHYRAAVAQGSELPPIWDTGFRIFSQFDEDGIILFLLGALGIRSRSFVDIGGGDGVWASNCANLALNLGFHGLFVDARDALVQRGRQYYARHPDTALFPPRFVTSFVTRDNVNDVLRQAGFEGEVDLLSIDIDGNEYWIWEAITKISPRIVVVETHEEFGQQSVVTPYIEEMPGSNRGHSPVAGASPAAMTHLANRLGYSLVGANRFGFNAFYVRGDVQRSIIPEVEVGDLFRHPRAIERARQFEGRTEIPFKSV